MATMSEEDIPGLVDLPASSVPAVGLNASLPASSGLGNAAVPAPGGLKASLPASFAKKKAAQLLQQERDAVSANALSQMALFASQAASTAANDKEKSFVNALALEIAAPTSSTSVVWVSFRRYANGKRDGFAVCLRCKETGKSNWDSEVKYGVSHSTSKLLQHTGACHREDHKRRIELVVVEEERKAGTTLLAALNVAPGVAAVDNYVEWIALGCLPLDICESTYFRQMIISLNPKSPLGHMSSRAAKEKVLFTYRAFLIYSVKLYISLSSS